MLVVKVGREPSFNSPRGLFHGLAEITELVAGVLLVVTQDPLLSAVYRPQVGDRITSVRTQDVNQVNQANQATHKISKAHQHSSTRNIARSQGGLGQVHVVVISR